MCGITGIFSVEGLKGYRDALQAANDRVSYRGPDGAGFILLDTHSPQKILQVTELPEESAIVNVTLALGHRRLAVIDLSPSGRQPMSYSQGELWITYNGEIYNYLELRAELQEIGFCFQTQSDTEVILAAYQAWGEACVGRLNGMWAFAIADLKQKRLFCSRDRFGIKPFYYYSDGSHFVFGSEIKQLLNFSFVPCKVNERAVYEFLAYGALEYDEETCFADIRRLLQGHNLVVDLTNGAVTTSCYYQPHFVTDYSITLREAAEEFQRLLFDSVRIHLRSDVEVGSCLSGGLDSSALVCAMKRLLHEEGKGEVQHTFSSHFEEEEANELEYAQEVIRATGAKSHFTFPKASDLLCDIERLVWHQDEPFGSTSIFAQWSVFKLVHQHKIKVMLDGQGADELLAGYLGLSYHYFQELRSKGQHPRLAWEVLQHTRLHGTSWFAFIPGRLGSLLRRLSGTTPPLPIEWIRPGIEGRYQGQSFYRATRQQKPFGEYDDLNNALYQYTFLHSLPVLLRYEDRNSMAFSVESRVPYLDYRLVEFLFSLPSHFKIRNGYTKHVMREGLVGILPEKIRHRTSKLGFATPERRWQQTSLRPLVVQAVQDGSLEEYILPGKAMQYLEEIERQRKLDFVPWRWISLSLWLKTYGLTKSTTTG